MKHPQIKVIIGFLLFLPSFSYVTSGVPVVLVTGFEPFGDYEVNPSQLIAETLNGSSFEDAEIIGIVLPVDFDESVERTIQAIEQYHPVLVISTGLAARTHTIRVEKIGINLKRYPLDNDTWSFPRRIDPPGPFLRFSSLPTKDIVREMRDANISARQSLFAGTYACNALFYQLLGYVTTQNSSIKIGFIHVPLLYTQDPQGMSLDTMVNAVKIAIQSSLE